mmetsp:Transcript_853/g.1247  ORF Transcript_853/g.1247 Transcript_853/m.1247 type:complete len:99 (-) Transcript_853:13-309(-)
MPNDEPFADVIINVHKGQNGYGIYFTQRNGEIVVTKLDQGSEAQKAGVQIDDRLIAIQDNDKLLPEETPGAPIYVNSDNYYRALDVVRSISYCRMSFL